MKKEIVFILTLLFVFACLINLHAQIFSFTPEEEIIGDTYYDLQSNAACQNRVYRYDDGTVGATWTLGLEHGSGYGDRGTGYNYFNGSSWVEWPTERIESDRAGWPSYAPLGETGEIVIAHLSGADTDALVINKRPVRGTGLWNESYFYGPPGHEHLLWPRLVTGGMNHQYIFLIAMTKPTANGGQPYKGMDGALVYSRSLDGGVTWDILNVQLPGTDSSFFKELSEDSYAFAEPKENMVAFVAGSFESDLFLMKSFDHGETYEKTVIWDHPYDQGYQIIPTDTFYCTDGSVATAIGPDGLVHVSFGITKTYYTGSSGYYKNFRDVDGLAYWNENMPVFSSDKNALNPSGHPNSELIPDQSLIGWAQDVNGDSTLSFTGEIGGYGGPGRSSFPQLLVDAMNRVFVTYSSVTETFDNGIRNYRRLWLRSSPDGGNSWGPFYHCFGNDSNYIFSEFAFPSLCPASDENIYLLYMHDHEPGITFQGSTFPYQYCDFRFLTIPKADIVGLSEPLSAKKQFSVSQNVPNPFSDKTKVEISILYPDRIQIKILDLTGRVIKVLPEVDGQIGPNAVLLDLSEFLPGIYFYRTQVGQEVYVNKMIVK